MKIEITLNQMTPRQLVYLTRALNGQMSDDELQDIKNKLIELVGESDAYEMLYGAEAT